MTNKINISIGIPVYNEKNNIESLLRNISSLYKKNCVLEKIYIADDCSTDGTIEIIERMANTNNKIILLKSQFRQGKIKQLNKLFETNKSELLVCFDSDIKIFDLNLLDRAIDVYHSKSPDLIAFHDVPLKQGTLVGKIINFSTDLWYETRKNINNGDSIHNLHGCGYMINKKFAKTIHIPQKAASDDEYLYIFLKKSNKKFYFAKNLTIYYKNPENIKDFIVQSIRHQKTYLDVEKTLGNKTSRYYTVPLMNKLNSLIKMCIQNPFYFTCALILNLCLKVIIRITGKKPTNINWGRIKSNYVKN